MPLKTIVKVSHLSNLSDARYCSGMGVDLLGFRVVEGDEYYMGPELFQDIRGWIAGPQIVAEIYGIQSTEEVARIRDIYAPDYFELTDVEYEAFHDVLTLPCLVAVTQTSGFTPRPGAETPSYLIVEEDAAADTRHDIPLLARATDLPSVERVLAAGFQGVVLPGPRQSRPGITNTDELGDVLEALEAE